ncbi:MAG: RnfABCDGE type electron transport complex subunit G [Deltaproteobacteria bacterium]|nr:RnfABCDGE type electron transport complex subunit G [Deltaproteobacteria bacterium]
MREMIKLFVIVALFSALSGGLLATIRAATKDRIEYQQLEFVKGPAIKEILQGCSNDPLQDRFKLPDGEEERSFFVGQFNGKRNTVAFETFGKGFGGDIGVIVAVNLDSDQIVGIGITTHSETPGVGSRAKTDPGFRGQFKDLSVTTPFKVKAEGGAIDAVTGATVSSKGVCAAVAEAAEIYQRLKQQIVEKTKA